MNPLDANIQSLVPTVMVPRYEELDPIRPDSHRYLAATDGMYVEIDRPWINVVLKTSESAFALPYGAVSPRCNLRIKGADIKDAFDTFIAAARAVCPVEHAAWLTYHPTQGGTLRYFAPEVLASTNDFIRYVRPDARPDSLPIIDCHSHGYHRAFYSQTDDTDDLNDDLKLALVIGNLDKGNISLVARLVGMGLQIDISEWVGALVQNAFSATPLN